MLLFLRSGESEIPWPTTLGGLIEIASAKLQGFEIVFEGQLHWCHYQMCLAWPSYADEQIFCDNVQRDAVLAGDAPGQAPVYHPAGEFGFISCG